MKVWLKGQIANVFKPEKQGNSTKVAFSVFDRMKSSKDGEKSSLIKCTAYGKNADIIIDDFSEKDSKGKLISKKIDLYGDMSLYEAQKVIPTQQVLKAVDVFEVFGYELREEDIDEEVNLDINCKVNTMQAHLYVKDIEYVEKKAGSNAKDELKKELGIVGLKKKTKSLITVVDDDADSDDGTYESEE